MECRVKDSIAPGNHTLFIGEIVQAARRSDASVLTTAWTIPVCMLVETDPMGKIK